jgi:hypothetical protein
VALLDSGSTTNFIHADLLSRLGLTTTPHPSLCVLVANGDRVLCQGVTRDIVLTIGCEEFTVTCFAITMGEFDLILDVEFLRTLGPILWDFESLCMTFTRRGRRILWRGLGAPHVDTKAPSTHAVAASTGQPLLDRLLLQFATVINEPRGLPPARPYDHRIHLLPATAPVTVRPYRYPQLQKDELKRQCSAMLQQGIIRPSNSSFSAPVLLVRKPDNSWRFCIDYHTLNAKTSKDKLPIPVVDELLEELHGAILHEAGVTLGLPPGAHAPRRHWQDSVSHSRGALRVLGDAFRPLQCASHILGADERRHPPVPAQVRAGVFR